MTIIVEDGSIVANANSYADIARADQYFEIERPAITDWFDHSDEQKEASLRFATKILDIQPYQGYLRSPDTQPLIWPRIHVWDDLRGRYVRPDEVPEGIVCATMEFAAALAREDRALSGESTGGGAGLKKAKIDVLELEWAASSDEVRTAQSAKPFIPSVVKDLICRYQSRYGCGMLRRVVRS